MSQSMNNCVMVGRLVADPIVRFTQDEKAVCSFRIAVNRRKEGEADFINCVAWQKLAEICGQYLKKGKQIAVSGRLQIRNWESKEGEKRSTAEIIVQDMQMLGKREDDGEGEARPAPAAAAKPKPAPAAAPEEENWETGEGLGDCPL